MNTSHLKNFAQDSRKKLIQQVGARLSFVLTTDSSELRENAEQVKQLREELNRTNKEQLIEKVAYTWFNRLMALRFMDANDYQPLGIRIITPKDGYSIPELLDEAKKGHIPDDLPLKKQHIYDLLDGKAPSSNPQNEAYKELLISACNHLNKVFPFLFERINDYTELLMPDDLISQFSIVQDMRDSMTTEDCHEVEIIGWLYQFYISERKDELINAKKKYKADEIAPVTQLFTPKWIVRYMVDNTLGQLWKESRPDTKLIQSLEFYIKPNNSNLITQRNFKSIEEIKFFDPCVGSAHILCYAFDLFYRMYEEEGYNPTEIPELILTNNLFGIDIDERAAQLAGFALMMKGRKHYRRFLRKKIELNITAFQNDDFHPTFKNAKILGSLIQVDESELDELIVEESTLFAEEQKQLMKQATLLASKYDIVVTNPPYLNSNYMDGVLKQFVEKEYNDTKSDLFACFLIQVKNLTKKDGLIGFISPYVWMFINSYEKLRNIVIAKTTITSLIQLEYNAFEPACVPIATFTLRNKFIEDYSGSYIKLSDFKGHLTQAPKTLEAIQNPNCGWFYTANQKDFEKIPASPIGYWLSEDMLKIYELPQLNQFAEARQGLATGDNNQFLRFWQEVSLKKSPLSDYPIKWVDDKIKWFGCNKGGDFRKWYGNNYYVVDWEDNGRNIKEDKLKRLSEGRILASNSKPKNTQYYFKEGLTWSTLTSSKVSFRYTPEGFVFETKGSMIFAKNISDIFYICGFLNSHLVNAFLKTTSPTLDYHEGPVGRLPYKPTRLDSLETIIKDCISISKLEWDSRETSWDLKRNNLIYFGTFNIEESYDLYQQYWKSKFFQLHRNEEELNRQFIEIYCLQEELTHDVPLEEITILKEETSIKNGKLVFNTKEVFAQFMSYAVGCMFGRYSLDNEGLILANQEETLQDFLNKVAMNEHEVSFLPDDDNIIPVLDGDWFEDDIVGRFYEFLKVSFGKENFDKNLAFAEDCLGKDIRKYFIKDYYPDHIKRYKKRPIYWMFSSAKGSFNVLIYMHRYTSDTVNNMLNNYLKEFMGKLNTRKEHLQHVQISGSPSDKSKAIKEIDNIDKMLVEMHEYERDVIYPLATERISIDLDDGVLVNYNKFGKAVKEVKGLNDPATKKKVRGFDWIDTTQIR